MKKKGFLITLACVCVASFSVGAVACTEDNTGKNEVSHNFDTILSYDATYHYYKCKDEGCTEVKDKATHTYTNGVCVCGKQENTTISDTATKLEVIKKIGKSMGEVDENNGYTIAVSVPSFEASLPDGANTLKVQTAKEPVQWKWYEENGYTDYFDDEEYFDEKGYYYDLDAYLVGNEYDESTMTEEEKTNAQAEFETYKAEKVAEYASYVEEVNNAWETELEKYYKTVTIAIKAEGSGEIYVYTNANKDVELKGYIELAAQLLNKSKGTTLPKVLDEIPVKVTAVIKDNVAYLSLDVQAESQLSDEIKELGQNKALSQSITQNIKVDVKAYLEDKLNTTLENNPMMNAIYTLIGNLSGGEDESTSNQIKAISETLLNKVIENRLNLVQLSDNSYKVTYSIKYDTQMVDDIFSLTLEQFVNKYVSEGSFDLVGNGVRAILNASLGDLITEDNKATIDKLPSIVNPVLAKVFGNEDMTLQLILGMWEDPADADLDASVSEYLLTNYADKTIVQVLGARMGNEDWENDSGELAESIIDTLDTYKNRKTILAIEGVVLTVVNTQNGGTIDVEKTLAALEPMNDLTIKPMLNSMIKQLEQDFPITLYADKDCNFTKIEASLSIKKTVGSVESLMKLINSQVEKEDDETTTTTNVGMSEIVLAVLKEATFKFDVTKGAFANSKAVDYDKFLNETEFQELEIGGTQEEEEEETVGEELTEYEYTLAA